MQNYAGSLLLKQNMPQFGAQLSFGVLSVFLPAWGNMPVARRMCHPQSLRFFIIILVFFFFFFFVQENVSFSWWGNVSIFTCKPWFATSVSTLTPTDRSKIALRSLEFERHWQSLGENQKCFLSILYNGFGASPSAPEKIPPALTEPKHGRSDG